MLEPQEISDFLCEGCQKKVDISSRSIIGETPNVLLVHLQRIVFSFETFSNEKINSKFEFPTTLDLRPYSYKGVFEKEHGADHETPCEEAETKGEEERACIKELQRLR